MRIVLQVSILVGLPLAAAARPITLPEALALAQRGNLELQAASAEVERARAEAHAARGQLGPRLLVDDTLQVWNDSFSVSFSGSPPILVRDQVTNSLTLSAAQPLVGLYPLGEQFGSRRRLEEAARADHRATRDEIAFRTTEAYLRLLEAADLSAIAEQAIRDIEEQARTAHALVEAGTLIEADYLRTQVALAQARQDLLRAQAQLGSTRAQLASIIGLPTGAELEPAAIDRQALPRLPAAPDEALAGLEQNRPELAAARSRAEAAELAHKAALGQLLPTVTAIAAYQHFTGSSFQPTDAAYVGGQLNWAFWEWGAQWKSIRAAEARAQQGELDAARRRRDVALETTQRFLDARAAAASIEVASTARTQAQEAYRVARALYENGSATTTDVLDAELALERARVNDARAVYAYLIAYHAFARAAGLR
jgi:outer membrane protein TolC